MAHIRKVALFFLGLDLKTADLLMQRLDRQVAHAVRREMLAIQDASPQEIQSVSHEFLQQVSSRVYQGKIPAATLASSGNKTAGNKIDSAKDAGVYSRPQPKQKIVGHLDTLEFSASPHIVDHNHEIAENANSRSQTKSTNDPNHLFGFLKSANAAIIAESLAHENTQTLVVVLAHMETETARDILATFPKTRQVEVMRRLSQWEETDDEVIRMIAEMLRERISKMQSPQKEISRGLSTARQLLATLDTHTRNHILEAIDRPTSSIAPTFTSTTPAPILAELASLQDAELAAVIRKVEPCVVMVAIAGGDNSLIARILKNFSQREQREIETQLAHFLPIDPRDVNEAQLVLGRALKQTTRKTSTNAVYA